MSVSSNLRRLWLLSCALAAAPGLFAAEAPPGKAELFGGAGFAFNTGAGTYAAIAGGAGTRLSRNLMVVGEFGYVPIKQNISAYGVNADATANTFLFDGTLQYAFPLKGSRVIPYVLGGGGMVHVKATAKSGWYSSSASTNRAVAVWGGGVRLGLSENFGIKPEVKGYTRDGTLYSVGVGAYYQFGK